MTQNTELPKRYDPLASPASRNHIPPDRGITWADEINTDLYPYISNLFDSFAQTPLYGIDMQSTYGRLTVDDLDGTMGGIEIEPGDFKNNYLSKMLYRDGPCLRFTGPDSTEARLIVYRSQIPPKSETIAYALVYTPNTGKETKIRDEFVPPTSEDYSDKSGIDFISKSALKLHQLVKEISWNVAAGHAIYQSCMIDGYDLNPYPEDMPGIVSAKKALNALYHELYSHEHFPLQKYRYLTLNQKDGRIYLPIPDNTDNIAMLPPRDLFDSYGFMVSQENGSYILSVTPMRQNLEECLLLVTSRGQNIKGEDTTDTLGILMNTTTDGWEKILFDVVSNLTYPC